MPFNTTLKPRNIQLPDRLPRIGYSFRQHTTKGATIGVDGLRLNGLKAVLHGRLNPCVVQMHISLFSSHPRLSFLLTFQGRQHLGSFGDFALLLLDRGHLH
jgi:hypothetical protein